MLDRERVESFRGDEQSAAGYIDAQILNLKSYFAPPFHKDSLCTSQFPEIYKLTLRKSTFSKINSR